MHWASEEAEALLWFYSFLSLAFYFVRYCRALCFIVFVVLFCDGFLVFLLCCMGLSGVLLSCFYCVVYRFFFFFLRALCFVVCCIVCFIVL